MQTNSAKNTIVLIGIGHTNAHILKMWKMKPIPDAQLICVTNHPIATYSGMLPGVIAGQYPVSAMEIDLVRLTASANVRLIVGHVTGIDRGQQRIQFSDRPDLAYDLLSIGVGSTPTLNGVDVAPDSSLVLIKPMQTLKDRLNEAIENFVHSNPNQAPQVSIVGGGIGSIEIAFGLNRFFNAPASQIRSDHSLLKPQKFPNPIKIKLVAGNHGVGTGLNESTRQKIIQQLEAKSIQVVAGQRVQRIDATHLTLADGSRIESDVTLWATHAVAPEILQRFDLKKDNQGFLLTRPTLQTVTDERIFAVGDTGTMEQTPTDKAGVFAVRQGPVLWENLQRFVAGRPLTEYAPQKDYLKLVNTADGKTISQYKGRSFYGGFWWWLKDRIDVKFMRMYQKYDPMPMDMAGAEDTEAEMRCLGCGGKIGSQVLSSVLKELDVPPHPSVVVGLDQPDDAAVVKTINNQSTVTTDFFASPLNDPYLVGRIAMLNSASDCFVMGAQPTAALAIIQLPHQHPRAQRQTMRELMAGSVEELKKMGATIVGGHSIEGPRLMAGFTVMGDQRAPIKTKGMLQPGDQLVLTKPLGSGVLLAALMQAKLPGQHFQELLDAMLISNQVALNLIADFGVSAITDVTGFGFAGHLKEMLLASDVSAKINLTDIPVLSGCQTLINAGVESTLAPDNRLVSPSVPILGKDSASKETAVLFDPQTCGGILLGLPASDVSHVLGYLNSQGFARASVVGEVVKKQNDGSAIYL